MRIDKIINWDFEKVHAELKSNNKKFGLVCFRGFEWGGSPSTLFIFDSMNEVREKILEQTNGKYEYFGIVDDDFHSMSFNIYKRH